VRVLLVDDEKIKRTALCDDLTEAGYETHTAACADEGMRMLRQRGFDVVVTDLRMKGMDGTTFLARIKEKWPGIEVIMITAYATVDNAVEAMKLGAFDYITKPFDSGKLIIVLDKISKIRELTDENASLRAELAKATRHGDIVGQSPGMIDALESLYLAISSDVPVLLCGETGTGKELFATAIHQLGPRESHRFIRVSCAALSPQLMESELFGHEKGAFTGAVETKPGRFELADKGTLLLDEIDDVPLDLQVKLLRVLEGFPFERVGGIRSITSDVRLIAASKVDLREEVGRGTFREDLYYRLSVLPIWIPPLRERREDIPLLVNHFLGLYADCQGPPKVEEEVMAILWDCDWPGNVRELQNVMRRILLAIGDRRSVTRSDVPSEVRLAALRGSHRISKPKSFREAIETSEKNLLAKALDAAGGNQSKAAATLDMKLSTFRDKLAKYGIQMRSGKRNSAAEGEQG